MHVAFLISLLLVVPVATAQQVSVAIEATHVEADASSVPSALLPQGDGYALGGVVLGVAAGYGLGAWAGYSVGRATDRDPADGELVSDNGLWVAWIGSSAGASFGAHFANGRRGNLWLGMLVSAVAQGLYSFAITRGSLDGKHFQLALGIPLIGAATSVAVERLTSR